MLSFWHECRYMVTVFKSVQATFENNNDFQELGVRFVHINVQKFTYTEFRTEIVLFVTLYKLNVL